MSLRRTLVLAFAAVAAAVAVLMGVASYLSAEHNLGGAVDQSLADAANTVLAGGRLALPADQPGQRGRGAARSLVQGAQRVAPDGTVTALGGTPLPVTPSDVALAGAAAGSEVTTETEIAPDHFRILTVASGTDAVMVGRDVDELDHALTGLSGEVAAVGGLVLAAAAGAGWLLARRMTRRLSLLTGAAEEVGATGRLDVALPEPGADEVGRLTASLQTMLGELARSRDDQRRLVQDASHELRTPLTSLRTNVQVLRRFADLPTDARQALLDDLEGETRELTGLVAELVELATDRRVEEQPEDVELVALAERAATRARRRSGREIVVYAQDATVVGRPQALDRAVANLLENAAKFDGDPAHPIELHVGTRRIEVRDRGPGVAPDDAAHVFDRFYRATAARGLPGSGLGLAIVREVALLHGGRPYLAPRPGGGAIVGFTLDAAR